MLNEKLKKEILKVTKTKGAFYADSEIMFKIIDKVLTQKTK